jgi:hypothetical protein
MDATRLEDLSLLFKALADPARLRILGLLADRPHAGHELADRLALTAPTISHHMRRLVGARLVDVVPDAQSRIYSLRTGTIRELSGSLPRLRQIPASRKKRVVVLRRLLGRFAPGRAYPESEVNDLLREAHDDVATLRRELVDYGFMVRDRGIYRIATELPDRGSTVAQEVGNEEAWFERLVAAATVQAIYGPDLPAAGTPAGQPE